MARFEAFDANSSLTALSYPVHLCQDGVPRRFVVPDRGSYGTTQTAPVASGPHCCAEEVNRFDLCWRNRVAGSQRLGGGDHDPCTEAVANQDERLFISPGNQVGDDRTCHRGPRLSDVPWICSHVTRHEYGGEVGHLSVL